MRKGLEIAWVEVHIALSFERKRPYCTGLNKYINTQSYVFQIKCISLPRYNNPSDRSSAAKDLRTL